MEAARAAASSLPLHRVEMGEGVDVMVARFDEVQRVQGQPGGTALLPDFDASTLPFRMKVSPPNRNAHGAATETVLELQDASGKQTFTAEASSAKDSHYIVILREVNSTSGETVYRALPVASWYNFSRATDAPQLNAEEQAEIFNMLQRIGPRQTAAGRIRSQWNGSADADGEPAPSASTGGRRSGGGAGRMVPEEDDLPAADNYRSSMAASLDTQWESKKRGRAGEAAGAGYGVGADGREEGNEVGDDVVTNAIDRIDGFGAGAGEDAFGGEGQGALDEGDMGGREFDVLGREAGGEEVAVDYEVGFDDDAGDAGDMYGEELPPALDATDMAEGEAALQDDEAAFDVTNEEEAVELQRRMVEAAERATAAASEPVEQQEVEAGRVVKRARMDARDPMSLLIEEVRRSFITMGGRLTSRALSKLFKRRNEEEGDPFKQMLIKVLRLLANRVALGDGSIEYVLKETA